MQERIDNNSANHEITLQKIQQSIEINSASHEKILLLLSEKITNMES